MHEFGYKVCITPTLGIGIIAGMRSLPGNLFEGRTLGTALEQVEIPTAQLPALAAVDRGHGVDKTRLLINGIRHGLTPKPIADIRRHSAIETDELLSRCLLKCTLGDAFFDLLCGCGYNIRKLLAHLRAQLALIIAAILNALHATNPDQQGRRIA
ncbi:MAG: hypothetical protein ACOH2H_20810 [Cypionkella sp.]